MPLMLFYPKDKTVPTAYIQRSNTIGKELNTNCLLFDDYYAMFFDKKTDDLPHITEIKVKKNSSIYCKLSIMDR